MFDYKKKKQIESIFSDFRFEIVNSIVALKKTILVVIDDKNIGLLGGVFRSNGVRQQVKAHYGGHNPRRKAQQQAHRPAGIPPEQAGHQSAQSRAAQPRQCGDEDHLEQKTHKFPRLPCCG